MKVKTLYFSPTGTVKKIVTTIAAELSASFPAQTDAEHLDFTKKEVRDQAASFQEGDLVVIGTPVYAGRVPNILLKYLNTVAGNGATAVCVVVYGNRCYDDALIELRDVATACGFHVIAAGAFVGEHSFSKLLAKGRPDADDLAIAKAFAEKIVEKSKAGSTGSLLSVSGCEPYRAYYMPKDKDGNPVDIRKVTPKTKDNCTKCMICAEVCPMDSIDWSDPSAFVGICIKCGACIKKCPVEAKYYDDPGYLRHQYELEEQFERRAEPELFV